MNLDDTLDFRVKSYNLLRTFVLLLAIVLVAFIKIYTDLRDDLKQLAQKFEHRDIILIPSSSKVTTAKLNEISTKEVKSEALYITNMLANISPDTAEANYLEIAKKMPERIKLKFIEKSANKIKYIKSGEIIESLKDYQIKTLQLSSYVYRVTVDLELSIIIDNENNGIKNEIMQFDLTVREPTLLKRWFFEITSFKRLSPTNFEKLKGVK